MKIGIIQPVIGTVGGNDKVLEQEIEALKDNDLTLFTFSKPTKKFNIPIKSKLPIKLPMFGIYQKLVMPQHDYSEMDVLISNGYHVKSSKPTIIYDVNQMANEFTQVIPSKYNSGFWKVYAQPYKIMTKFSKINTNAHYYSCSEYSATKLQNAIAKKVDVIYPPLSNDCFESDKQPYICIPGRISPEKNLETAILIANEFPNKKVIVTGSVTTTNKQYLSKLKSISGKNILFIENPSREEFMDIMATSKIFLTASKETFGITTIEAIASGCIPIVPDNSAHPETVPFTSLRYQSESDAIDKIKRIFENPGITESVQSRLKERLDMFSFNEFSKRLNNAIDGVLS